MEAYLKVLSDKKISARVKGKVYKAVVRPALLYGSETWAMKKAQERKSDVAEMRKLRWMCGLTNPTELDMSLSEAR